MDYLNTHHVKHEKISKLSNALSKRNDEDFNWS